MNTSIVYLGDVDFRYNEPIIVGSDPIKGYRLNPVSTGAIEAVFAPRRK